MGRRSEIGIVYATGLAQGLSLVTFPAAGTIFTSPESYHLTSGEYGDMFLPMVIFAILGSSLGAGLGRRFGLKTLLLVGLISNLVSMAVLIVSQFFTAYHGVAYGLLLVAMVSLGVGFGTILTAIQTYAAEFFPEKKDVAIMALQSLLGTGTALAPLLVAFFAGVAVWWLLPVLVVGGFLALTLMSLNQPLQAAFSDKGSGSTGTGVLAFLRGLSPRFWVFCGIAFLYGICETLFGNWATIYLNEDKGLSLHDAAFALAAFWAMITAGRIVVTFISTWISDQWIYRILPVPILVALVTIPRIGVATGSIVAYGFAGLACSAFLPLSVSFAQGEFSRIIEAVSGGVMAAYMLGYGIASFGVGPLRGTGITLSDIYTGSSILPVGMTVLAFFLTKPWMPRHAQPDGGV
jgi:fucose permease